MLPLGRSFLPYRFQRPEPCRGFWFPPPEGLMSALQVTARLTIHEGKLDEFKEVAARCMQSVREKDSGTLQYDWFLNAH